jgi:hypothetical protein
VKKFKGRDGWRELAGEPPKLPEDVKSGISSLYKAFCNDVTGRSFFDVPKIKEVVRELREVLQ